MNRSIEKTVFSGFVTAWRFATWPTSRSPVLVNATTDGVIRLPSGLVMTTGSPPSMTATTEFVVPRSMPMIFSAIEVAPISREGDARASPLVASASGVPENHVNMAEGTAPGKSSHGSLGLHSPPCDSLQGRESHGAYAGRNDRHHHRECARLAVRPGGGVGSRAGGLRLPVGVDPGRVIPHRPDRDHRAARSWGRVRH